MSVRVFLIVGMVIALTMNAGCGHKEEPINVSLEKTDTTTATKKDSGGRPIRFAVGAMLTPKEGFVYYKHFLDYIGERMGRHIEFVDREDYEEINDLLKSGGVDAAFVCSGPYVDGHRDFGLELIAAPLAYGKTVYYSYIIVSKDSPIRNFEELRGKTFAFTDPMSNTGTLVPTYMLAKMKETPDSFFKKYVFSHSHDKSIKAVSQGIVDGAAVDSLIWDYLDHRGPAFTSKTRIILKSSAYAIPPVVVRPGLAPEIKRRLKHVILTAHLDKRGASILREMAIEKFVAIDDAAYDSIRKMKAWTDARKKKK